MRTKWTVSLKSGESYVKIFTFYDFNDVLNLISCMVEGSSFVSIDIDKREVTNE